MVADISLNTVTLWTFFTVFIFGVLVSFTPCVYPVLPIIVAYIGGSRISSRWEGFLRSTEYVLGLCVTYSLLGALAALTGVYFGKVQSGFWSNFVAANVFIVMGLVMLDVFNFPQISPLRRFARPGGSAFLLGAFSGMVIGPCTTPILGAVLAYVANRQNPVLGVSLLFAYALGMGIPLLVLGTFVGLLKKLPRAGEWMVRVKKIFGLMMIAAGEYFLLQAAG